MLSLQRWQSYLGLILVEKEETLAASSRLHSTFVSKFIKTEMEKKKVGVGKAEGGGKTSVQVKTERRDRRERRDTADKMQQGKHFYNAKKSPSSLKSPIKSYFSETLTLHNCKDRRFLQSRTHWERCTV